MTFFTNPARPIKKLFYTGPAAQIHLNFPMNFMLVLQETHLGNLLMGIDNKTLKDMEFQFVCICSLLSNTRSIRKQNGSKLQVVS